MIDNSSGDPAVATRPRRLVRGVVAGFLLPLAILGALALSAAATLAKAARHGVPVEVQPFAVAMLEVVSLTGTLLWLFAPDRRLRRHAALATMAASGVQLAAGLSAYGWFGAVAPIALVVTTHLASEAWRADWRTEETVDTDRPSLPEQATARLRTWWGGPATADVAPTSDAPPAAEPDDEPGEPTTDETPALPEVPGVTPAAVAKAIELIEAYPAIGRPNLVEALRADGHDITSHRCKVYLLPALEHLRVVRPIRTGEAS